MESKDKISTEISLLRDYLEKNGYRQTPERFEILREVCSMDGLFDVNGIYLNMKKRNYRVSKATIYNSFALFEKCLLITRNYFGRNQALFEVANRKKTRDHLVCSTCGKVISIKVPRGNEIQGIVGDLMNFDIRYHTFNLYVNCLSQKRECQK